MTENTGSSFEPLSDEQLARLLEDQMRVLRGDAPAAPPAPEVYALSTVEEPAPVFEPAVEEIFPQIQDEEEDEGIAALFGALLEDTTELEQVSDIVVEKTVVSEVVDFDSLGHTQPITYLAEEVVTASVVDEHLIVEDTVVEEVFTEPVIFDGVVVEDAHVVAARVMSEISIDGEVVATTVAATAGVDPIPHMFGDVTSVDHVLPPVEEPSVFAEVFTAAVVAETVSAEPLTSEAVTEAVPHLEPVEEPAPAFYAPVVEEESVEVVAEEFTSPVFRSSSPVSSFAPRPSFDELVFGVSAED
ncbi:hypothetical protein M2119_001301 [Aurantimicrobium minutum]|uniref:hypothetical protein n=1 Tax=Aurantimicrobium minutum TaxID=708131 RepID=UPI002475296D|nr:hypothetical protein [Aurantimicrobium minutum]MDH6533064.1 hypothetical protein [Aurantimicrobium minutum]